jgi:hypothetical protein
LGKSSDTALGYVAYTTRTRFVSFTRADLDAYGDVLSANFPRVCFQVRGVLAGFGATEPVEYERMADCVASPAGTMSLMIRLGKPVVSDQDRERWASLGLRAGYSVPYAHLSFPARPGTTARAPYQSMPPFVDSFQFSFLAQRDDPAAVKAMEKAVRLLRKVAWNGLMDFYFLYTPADAPFRAELRERAIRSSVIMGRDAVRWTQENPASFVGVYLATPHCNGWRPSGQQESDF